jgi:hypothetical protein
MIVQGLFGLSDTPPGAAAAAWVERLEEAGRRL